jgi:cytidine deaminase
METLIRKAMEARKHAYAPYSHFQVGACLQGKNGEIYTGCNVENSSYSATNCAERTAIFHAVSQGTREFQRIIIVGGKENGNLEICPPCGVCRQVMSEFCDAETFEIVLATSPEKYETYLLKELLPLQFGNELL